RMSAGRSSCPAGHETSERVTRRLADGWGIERAIDESIQADHLTSAADRHELDGPRVAGLEPDGGPRRDGQAHAILRGAIEVEAAIDLEEMEVGADLHRAISGVGDLESPRRSLGIDFDWIACQEVFSGDHGITVWVVEW